MREVFVRGPEKGLNGLWRRNVPGDGSPNRSWAGLCDLEQGPACGQWSFRSRNQKGEHFKSFRDGPPEVKWFLGWDVISRNSQYLASGKPFLCLQSARSCLIEVGPQIRD